MIHKARIKPCYRGKKTVKLDNSVRYPRAGLLGMAAGGKLKMKVQGKK